MTKNDVINFFRALPAAEPEQFNRALEMYRKSPAHNAGLVRQYNASGYSKTTLANLLYDLQQLWGIKDVEKLPVKKKEAVQDETQEPPQGDSGNADTGSDDTGSDSTGTGSDTGKEPEADDKLKFRDEYPFLKLESCPAELKILATDKITAYNSYQEKHALLAQIADGTVQVTEDEKAAIAAAAVAEYEKGEAIKAEFDYYRDTNQVLGKHPVFADLALKREIDSLSIEECHKEIKNAAPYISKKKKSIAKAKSEEEKAKLQAELKAREEKLKKVKEKLGIQ
jgi:hypothetical protein